MWQVVAKRVKMWQVVAKQNITSSYIYNTYDWENNIIIFV